MAEHFKYLRLKSGVAISSNGTIHYLGLPSRGILLNDPIQLQIARYFNGERHTKEIARGLLCDLSIVENFADILSEEGLLDHDEQPTQSTSKDFGEQLISLRRDPESALITYRTGVKDAGTRELNARLQSTILISGENRLAHSLLVALQASGFSHTRLIGRSHLATQITEDDLCGIVVRTSDIGKNRNEFIQELIRNAQITRSPTVPKAMPDLIISTIPLEWDYVQRWMSEGSVHLHINPLIGGEIEIGPLVIPGDTPCLRCVTLIKRDAAVAVDSEFVRTELPSAAIAYVSGLIALAVGEYFATGASTLLAASYWYDLLNPLRPPEQRHWNFHPECGCQ